VNAQICLLQWSVGADALLRLITHASDLSLRVWIVDSANVFAKVSIFRFVVFQPEKQFKTACFNMFLFLAVGDSRV
jgi:hypothetical protein